MSELGSDGMEDVLGYRMRQGLTAAQESSRYMARFLRVLWHQIKQARERQQEQLAAWERLRDEARQTVAQVHDAQWWDQTSPEEVARTYETMLNWRDLDPEIAKTEKIISAEVKNRYGIDPKELPTYVQTLEDRAQQTDAQQAEQPKPDEKQTDSELSYDASSTAGFNSYERLEQLKIELHRQGLDPELIESRVRLASMHERPVGAASSPPDAAEHERALRRLRGRSAARPADKSRPATIGM